MPLSTEAVIAIVTLLITCPPTFVLIWAIYWRRPHFQRQRMLRMSTQELNVPIVRIYLRQHTFTEKRTQLITWGYDCQAHAYRPLTISDNV